MTQDIHIPPEVVEAGARAIASDDGWPLGWEDYMDTATAAIRAALEAWPGMTTEPRMWRTAIILPITTENPDA